MSNITNNSPVVTEQKLTEFYEDIKPYLGCPAYVTQEGDAEYYSTDEKVIGRWTDGKPLYQKVIYVDSITFNNTTEQNIDTSTLLDKTDIIVREFYGGYYCDLGTNTEQHHNFGYEKYSNTEYYYSAYYRQADDVIKVRGTWGGINPWTIYRVLFIVKYIKKSDSAATTIEQKPTHYSTNEQVVGTWIDGKPVYQKTYNLTNTVELTKDNWTIINEVSDLANISAIIDCNAFTSGGTFMVVHASVDSNKLKLGAPSSSNFRYIINTVTIKYIKTTD